MKLRDKPDYLPASVCESIPELSPAYYEGYDAAINGGDSSENPYMLSDNWESWIDGFCDGLEDKE
jgi:ribosome modulation factor